MEDTPIVNEVAVPAKNVLFEVTPASRVLAAILFITLPFVGFWIGYTHNDARMTGDRVPPMENPAVTEMETVAIPATLVQLEKVGIKSTEVSVKPLIDFIQKEIDPKTVKDASIKSTEVAVKPIMDYVQKMELDPTIVNDARAKEKQDMINAGGWYEVANAYISEDFLNRALVIDPIKLGAESMEYLVKFGPGYFHVVEREPVQAVTLRHIYGDSSYVVHSTLDGFMGAKEIKEFATLYTSSGSDFSLINSSQTLIREGESWVSVPILNGKYIKFITPELDDRKYDVFYFTDGKNIYAMYGNRPYEGCCTIMTGNMFTVVGGDLSSFEIIDKATALDKNNVYTSTVSEKGGVNLSISAR